MVGTIDIAPDGSCLLVSFPYREDLVSLVRNIPGRRWDKHSKVWKVPLNQVETTVKMFLSHGFRLSPEVTTALATDGRDTGLQTLKLGDVDQQAPALTVSALNLRVAEVLNQSFKEPLWVIGELQNYEKGKRGRHRYFELVERNEDEEGARPRAVVAAAIFDKAWTFVNQRLTSAAHKIELRDGLKVRVRGRVDLYQQRGRYQFLVEDIDPNYTLGELLVRREKILADLDELGLRDRNIGLETPLVPLRIALITSEDSDAFNDFVQTLAATHFGFQVTLYPVFVQGERLRPTVLNALTWFAERSAVFDLLVIIRGGGSRSELGSWDDFEVAKALATHPLKAIIGIGHERDQCVLDCIATSVKTPTAAAELIVERVTAYQRHVEDTLLEVLERAQLILSAEKRELLQRAGRLKQAVRAGLAGARSELRAAGRRLTRSSTALLGELRRGIVHKMQVLVRGTDRRLERERFVLEAAGRRMATAGRRQLEREHDRLEQREARCRALDPTRVLGRGYAILRGKAGKALRSVEDTEKNELLDAQLADGRLGVRVEDIERVSER